MHDGEAEPSQAVLSIAKRTIDRRRITIHGAIRCAYFTLPV